MIMHISNHLFDLIGIGFGPSNIALAIALDELTNNPPNRLPPPSMGPPPHQLSRCFLEKQPQFIWHGGMLLPSTDMQISFLKDLVSLRNPTSTFTFINYLRHCNRLESFINRKTFFPSRIEFNAYLGWAAAHFKQECHYGENVIAITPTYLKHQVIALKVHTHDPEGRENVRHTKNLALATGGQPRIPERFATCNDQRIVHSSQYLTHLEQGAITSQNPLSVAVVGAGQSAAEILLDLHDRFPQARIDLIMRGSTLKPADDSPSINQIFNPEYTNYFHAQPRTARQALLREFRHTNYAVVDLDLIERIHTILYEQSVVGESRLQLFPTTTIQDIHCTTEGILLKLMQGALPGTPQRNLAKNYQHIILATGYQRNTSKVLLQGLVEHLPEIRIGRDYRVETPEYFLPSIFIQGDSEDTHGLSDTLLSVIAIRAQEIAESLMRTPRQTATADPMPPTTNLAYRQAHQYQSSHNAQHFSSFAKETQ